MYSVSQFSLSNNYTVFIENHNLWRFDLPSEYIITNAGKKIAIIFLERIFMMAGHEEAIAFQVTLRLSW